MGRKRLYETEEERKEAALRYQRKHQEKVNAEAGRDGVNNPCKHRKLKHDGIVIDIGTLDRTRLDTAYVEMRVTISYTADEEILDMFKRNVHKAFNEWLFSQDMWDRRNRIAIMECAKANPTHPGKYKMLTYQYHVRRDVKTSWEETADNLEALVKALVTEVKKTCIATGLALKNWVPNPTGKNSATPKLADALSSDATEVD